MFVKYTTDELSSTRLGDGWHGEHNTRMNTLKENGEEREGKQHLREDKQHLREDKQHLLQNSFSLFSQQTRLKR